MAAALTIVGLVLPLRLVWIFGLISTSDYAKRTAHHPSASGSGPVTLPGSHFSRLESALLEDRIAVVLFLLGALILTYTVLNSPAFV